MPAQQYIEIRGTDDSDTDLNGGDKAEKFWGRGGNDTIDAGGGDDIVYGGRGNDQVRGGEGKDQLNGEAGNDQLRGGNGEDRLDGGAGNDRLWGNADNDKLNGGAGRDTLIGGAGDDQLTGGKGADVFRFLEASWGNDVVKDFNADQGDLLSFNPVQGPQSFADLNISEANGDTVIEYNGNTVTLEGVAAASLDESSFVFANEQQWEIAS